MADITPLLQQIQAELSAAVDGVETLDMSVMDWMEMIRKHRGQNKREFCREQGIEPPRYSEHTRKKRPPSRRILAKAYKLGVPAQVILREL